LWINYSRRRDAVKTKRDDEEEKEEGGKEEEMGYVRALGLAE